MSKEEFTAIGLSEELATKAAEASKKELEGYVPKEKLTEAEAAKGQLEKDLASRDKQLEEIKKSSGDNTALQEQITTLQAENKAAKEQYAAELKELKLTTAIKLAMAGKVHDEDIAVGLVDKSKLILSEDGKVTGLEEQLKTLKESKAFLFKPDGSGAQTKLEKHYSPKGGTANEQGLAHSIAESMNKEAATNPYANAWG